jgi:hypothetical protein
MQQPVAAGAGTVLRIPSEVPDTFTENWSPVVVKSPSVSPMASVTDRATHPAGQAKLT